MYNLFDVNGLKKENFKFRRENEDGKIFLGLKSYEWGVIVLVLFLLLCISIFISNNFTDSILSFWGSIMGGLVSGFLTLFGVVIAFKLESERRNKIHFKKIRDNYADYLHNISVVFETLQLINLYISDENGRSDENYNKILKQIKDYDFKELHKKFEIDKGRLEGLSRTMSHGFDIYFLVIENYWDYITETFKLMKNNKKKEQDLKEYFQKNYSEIQLATHILLATVSYTNNDGDSL